MSLLWSPFLLSGGDGGDGASGGGGGGICLGLGVAYGVDQGLGKGFCRSCAVPFGFCQKDLFFQRIHLHLIIPLALVTPLSLSLSYFLYWCWSCGSRPGPPSSHWVFLSGSFRSFWAGTAEYSDTKVWAQSLKGFCVGCVQSCYLLAYG